MKRSKRKQALTNRMMKVGLYWADTDAKHEDGYYHVTIAPRWGDTRLRTLDGVEGYVMVLEDIGVYPPTLLNDIIGDFCTIMESWQ